MVPVDSSRPQVSPLNSKDNSPPFAATVAAAAPLQHYQEDPVHQPWGLRENVT